ncbi:4-amino-4-deoxy-L-arabinose transferase [bacterium]|nr:4-amino-4-deoxy-L-arabinose transferase [bacterium]
MNATTENLAPEREQPISPVAKGVWKGSLLIAIVSLAALLPTAGDLGLTWDEPAYRYSQLLSAQWWERVFAVRSWDDFKPLIDPDTLHYYWPYGHFGVNFHPTLSGQLSLLTNGLFGGWTNDIVGRRLASIFEFAGCVTLLFAFLTRRYSALVGGIAAATLLFMPRPFGDAHVAGTDMPGMLLWSMTAIAFWKGIYEPRGGKWRIAVGVLLGLAFVQKMAAVFVVGPLVLWTVMARWRGIDRKSLLDALLTLVPQLAVMGLTLVEIRRLAGQFPPPGRVELFVHNPAQNLPDWILAVPLVIWLTRRGLGRALAHRSRFFAENRPTLETITASAALAPVIAWAGNPAWWVRTLPRLAHYYQINTDRQGALPNIQILYLGKIYEYSLPWHNGFLLIAVTVPVLTLAAAAVGLFWGFGRIRTDRLPAYFALHMFVPVLARMFRVPAHDGVRLMLPVFFFLSAFAGWGAVALGRRIGRSNARLTAIPGSVVVLASLWQLVSIHPYELSYYNEAIGGAANAWRKGYELTYWYDALTPEVLAEINAKLPEGAEIQFANDLSNPTMVIQQHQDEGRLRPDIVLGAKSMDRFTYMWLLTHDSKALAFTRALFVMKPWYESRPKQLSGARALAVMDPDAVSRAWALQLMCDAPDRSPKPKPNAPEWARKLSPALARFWGDGLDAAPNLAVNEPMFEWAANDPEVLRAAATQLVAISKSGTVPKLTDTNLSDPSKRLLAVLTRYDKPEAGRDFSGILFRARPEGLAEGVEILIRHGKTLREVMLRSGYTDPNWIGGPVDGDSNVAK